MCKRMSPEKKEANTGCVRETHEIKMLKQQQQQQQQNNNKKTGLDV